MPLYRFFAIALVTLITSTVAQADDPVAPRVEARVDGERVDDLPLLMTSVEARISGVIADVSVTQHYANDGTRPVEAVFVFPASPDAAVYGYEMQVNNRLIRGEVQEKEQARETYEEARDEGRTASLLETVNDGFFRTTVGNVLPGDDIRVTLFYVETLIPDRGQYTFDFPLIRQTREGRSLPNDARSGAPVRRTREIPFDILVDLNTSVPISEVDSPSHEIDIDYLNPLRARIVLDPDDIFATDRGFVLNYRLGGDEIQAGLLSYETAEENFFLLMAEPPGEVPLEMVPPREYQFVVDVSGSMNGEPLELAKKLARDLLSQMRPIDRFNLHLFAGAANSLARDPVEATPSNVDQAISLLDLTNAGGGTNLLPVLETISAKAPTPGVSRSVVVISDGGISAGGETLRLIRDNLGQQNMFVLGVGRSINDRIIDSMARTGRGQAFKISQGDDGEQVIGDLMRYILQPVLTDISVEFPSGISAYDMIPEQIPDVFSERPVFLVGKWEGQWNGPVVVRGMSGSRPYAVAHEPEFAYDNEVASGIRLLWARERLRELEMDDEFNFRETLHKDEITELGLTYGLASRHTSFVATDYEVRVDPTTGSEQVALARMAPSQPARRLLGLGFAPRHLVGELRDSVLPEPSLAMARVDAIGAPSSVSKRKASITFLLGEDEDASNSFYAAAEAYFSSREPDARVIKHLRSLSEARDWLEDHRPASGRWARINVVVHGFAWTGLGVPLDADRPKPEGSFPLELRFDPSEGLADSILNSDSEIRLYGCGLGRSARLLDQISMFFGGADEERPVIVSPEAPIAFELTEGPGGRQARYLLYRTWPVFSTGESPLSRSSVAEMLKHEHGSVHDWSALLESEDSHFRTDRVAFSIEIPGMHEIPEWIGAMDAARQQPALLRYLEQTDMQVDDLAWRYEQRGSRVMIVGEAWLHLLSVPRGESDPAGQFVQVRPPSGNALRARRD